MTTEKENIKLEIKKIVDKIKFLVSQLSGIISANKMKNILGTLAIFIGVSFANTASAQYFQSPVNNPFSFTTNYSYFAVPELADLDGDGDLDMLVNGYGYYTQPLVYEENIGTSTTPLFSTPMTNPFGISPVPMDTNTLGQFHNLVDIDGDGDLDILLTAVAEKEDTTTYTEGLLSTFRYYENTGTSTNPQFSSPTINPFGLSTDSSLLIGKLIDIDNDGDFDIVAAANNISYYGMGAPAYYKFFENIGDSMNPLFASAVSSPFGLPNAHWISAPSFTDLDNDGDFDMLVGETYVNMYYNKLEYFENNGTATNANFLSLGYNPFGLQIDTLLDDGLLIPDFSDLDNDGDMDLIVGGYYGNISYYENDTTAPPPVASWDCVAPGNCQDPGDASGQYWDFNQCMSACPIPVTYDCDVVTGCYDPGTGQGLYTSLTGCQANCNTTSINSQDLANFNIFPNPVSDVLNIKSDKEIIKVEISDVLGKIILSESKSTNKINVEKLQRGLYSIKITFKDESSIKHKIVK